MIYFIKKILLSVLQKSLKLLYINMLYLSNILQAAAILHDVAIKYCKEHYNGDASQNNQKQVVSILVTRFLESANYLPSYVPKIIEPGAIIEHCRALPKVFLEMNQMPVR